jgi:hypothetical protein
MVCLSKYEYQEFVSIAQFQHISVAAVIALFAESLIEVLLKQPNLLKATASLSASEPLVELVWINLKPKTFRLTREVAEICRMDTNEFFRRIFAVGLRYYKHDYGGKSLPSKNCLVLLIASHLALEYTTLR